MRKDKVPMPPIHRVIPAKAGISVAIPNRDPRLRGDDLVGEHVLGNTDHQPSGPSATLLLRGTEKSNRINLVVGNPSIPLASH